AGPPVRPRRPPRLPAASGPPERLAKAQRNCAMAFIRPGLPRLAELFGPAEAAHLGRRAGRLIGALYRATAALLGIGPAGAEAFGAFMVALCSDEGEALSAARMGDALLV